MEVALCNWALQKVAARGFLPMTTPDLVRESILEKCGFQPRAENSQVKTGADLEHAIGQNANVQNLATCMAGCAVRTTVARAPLQGAVLKFVCVRWCCNTEVASPLPDQVYSVRGMPLCLTGTAEVPLGAVYMDQIIAEEQLPIRMAAYGHCFRTEAGSAGAPAACW